MLTTLDFDKACHYIINRLGRELPSKLTYHGLEHTVNEVVPAANRLANLEKVTEDDRLLLLTAAYYHDSGFLFQREGHELASIQLAEQVLPKYGYTHDSLVVIRGLIQATHIPQSPTNLLEKIMSDADLDYLGQAYFWKRSKDLRQELENYGAKFSDVDWYLYQLRFIKEHQYFTASERSLRDIEKHKHVLDIQKHLEQAIQYQKMS